MENVNFNIPKEKFQFASRSDINHDKKLDTKPRSYMQDAFSRFCKNKGAVVAAIIIICLVLFAIIVPFCTPYRVDYTDNYFKNTLPKAKMFANTSFWDGCEAKEDGKLSFMYYYAMGQETGHNAVKNQEYKITDDGMYKYRLDSYHSTGMVYMNITLAEYASIQKYQNEFNKQVIYPTVNGDDRPKSSQDKDNANYYYQTKGTSKTEIVYDKDGNVIPVYSKYEEGEAALDGGYNSLRIEGEDGITVDGKTYFYNYAFITSAGVEIGRASCRERVS